MTSAFADDYFELDFEDDIDDLGHERGPIEFEKVVAAARLVDQSGALEIIAAQRALDRLGKGPGGRKALISDRTILTLLMLLALEHDALHLTLARYIVTNRLGQDSLRYLDLKMGDASDETVYHRLARAFQRFMSPVDPYKGSRRKRLTSVEHELLKAARDASVVDEKNNQLHRAANGLVAASVKKMPRSVAECFRGDYAIDATLVKANGKRGTDRITKNYIATEYDAGPYHRPGDHGPADNPTKNKGKNKHIWGFEMATTTMVRASLSAVVNFPLLIVSLAWDAPSSQPGQNGLKAFRSIVENGFPIDHVIADRAYYAGAAVHNFHEQMHDWGFKPVTDYKDTQLGIQAECCGAIQVEGTWYCPSMPEGLIEATIEFRETRIDQDMYDDRIDARRQWAAVRKSRPDENGTVRWSHPTGLGDRCKGEDKFCTQTTISQPRKVGLKLAQEYPYMSAEWKARYPLRNAVESTNATMKRGATHNLGDPERRRLRGRASQFILSALVVVAVNIKKIRDFKKAEKKRSKIEAIKANRKRVPFGHSTMNEDERQTIAENRREIRPRLATV